MTNFEKVKQFHEVFGLSINDSPSFPNVETVKLRLELIEEELTEFRDAITDVDFIEAVDAIIDTLYVVYGAAVDFGIDADALFAHVHDSNMSKLDVDGKPIYRDDGKVLKGPFFWPPKIAEQIEKATK